MSHARLSHTSASGAVARVLWRLDDAHASVRTGGVGGDALQRERPPLWAHVLRGRGVASETQKMSDFDSWVTFPRNQDEADVGSSSTGRALLVSNHFLRGLDHHKLRLNVYWSRTAASSIRSGKNVQPSAPLTYS